MAKTYKASNIKERAQQTAAWCRDNSPTQYPVVVRWKPELKSKAYAEASKVGRKFYIDLSWKRLRNSYGVMNETIIHEWSHCSVWLEHRDIFNPVHDPIFSLEFGRLYSLWNDGDGFDESKLYKFKKVRLR